MIVVSPCHPATPAPLTVRRRRRTVTENGEGYRAPSGPIRTSNLELVCVGNYAGRLTDTQCQVMVITEVIDHTKKSGLLYQTNLYVKSFKTIDNIHYCSYEIPDGVVCFYRRRIQTVPSVNEGRFFRMDDGVYTELGVGSEAIEYIACFLRDYVEHLHYKIGLVATPTNYYSDKGIALPTAYG